MPGLKLLTSSSIVGIEVYSCFKISFPDWSNTLINSIDSPIMLKNSLEGLG